MRSPSVAQQAAADHDVVGARRRAPTLTVDRIAGCTADGAVMAALLARPWRRPADALAAQAGDDLVDDRLVRHVARFDRDVGLGIDRIALVDQPPQRLDRIGVLEQRPVVAALDAARSARRAVARSQTEMPLARIAARVSGFMKAPPPVASTCGPPSSSRAITRRLAGAEIRLAVGGEDLRDRHAGGLLDLGVGIDERQAEARRQPAADRRLAGAHHADQHDRARPQAPRPARIPAAPLAALCIATSDMVYL